MWNFDLVIQELKRQRPNGKTQRGLAEYLGVTEQQVSDWKRKRIKTAWTVYIPKIAEYLGVSPETFDDEPERWRKKESATQSDDELFDYEIELIKLAKRVPEKDRRLVLDVIETVLRSRGLLE